MKKAEMIERFGEEYYERFKARCRENSRKYYSENREREQAKHRQQYYDNPERYKNYAKERNILYKINSRDTNRFYLMGGIPEGMELHHFKYHANKNDETWIDDVALMTREEHRKWHVEHPNFNAMENIVY